MKKRSTSTTPHVLLMFTLFTLLLGPIYTKAQTLRQQAEFAPIVETTVDYDVKEFTCKKVNNNLYFKFLVLENKHNISYILESSSDGKTFEPIQRKEGFKSPNQHPLLYSYKIDLNKSPTETAYRIRRISPDGNEYSAILEIKNIDQIEYIAQNN